MPQNKDTDIVLIGAGIMSATLGMLLKELEPNYTIRIFERLDQAAQESSDAWNNAGTGHSAFCELNYTPEKEDGTIDISKAVKVAEAFELSRQFWAWLVQQDIIESDAPDFIRSIPHMSFVWGENNVAFLQKRYEAMRKNPLFKNMQFSEDPAVLRDWIPLMMQGRKEVDKLAATRMDLGTDVDFGVLTRSMIRHLEQCKGVYMHFNQEVKNIDRLQNGSWEIKLKDRDTGTTRRIDAKFVFIGAGGGSLPLLLKSDIPEGKGFGGFPVSGQWLRCTNEEVIKKHEAKVYGKAAVGSPPMSVPHLDSRMIAGKKALLFGPYAGFSTKFLKEGSFMDLPLSVRAANIVPMLSVGIHNIPLTKYLIQQVTQSDEERLEALKEYYPGAKMEDWELEIAGQRVQVIKKDEEEGGILEFGTEVVSAADGSLAALLGASPGASTAVSIMLNLIKKCFKEKMESADWKSKIKKMIPSYGQSLADDEALLDKLRHWTSEVLELEIPVGV